MANLILVYVVLNSEPYLHETRHEILYLFFSMTSMTNEQLELGK